MSQAATAIPKAVIPYARVLGAVVEHHRKRLLITQEAMAKAIGVSQSAYSRLVQGQSAMSVVQLRAISAQLGLPPEAIVHNAEGYAAQLQQQGVSVTDKRPDSAAGVLIALGILAALVAAAKS
jgi:transcriptional regulator with XRE-family HTH domain